MKHFVSLLLATGLVSSSCVPFPTEQGVCSTARGDVRTYNIIGVWRKVPLTNEEKHFDSAGNFKLLYIVQGGATDPNGGELIDGGPVYLTSLICEEVISNNDRAQLTKLGSYFHDDGRSRIRLRIADLTEQDPEPIEQWVDYDFSGSCSTTRLHLDYGNGKKEQYTFYSSTPPESACEITTQN